VRQCADVVLVERQREFGPFVVGEFEQERLVAARIVLALFEPAQEFAADLGRWLRRNAAISAFQSASAYSVRMTGKLLDSKPSTLLKNSSR
jgi:hypothetical protein